MLRALGSIWSWTAIVLVIVLGFFLQLAIFVLTAPFDRRRYLCGRFFRLMAVMAAWLIPYWKFSVLAGGPRSVPGNTVAVSNHASQADVFLLSHLPWEMKWLGKASLFRVPFFGWSMWLAGDIPVHRGERDSAARAMEKCARWLSRGMPVMIFPEGTRSLDGALLPFKDGAFRLALETGSFVLPIAIHGTHAALPKRSWHFGQSRAQVAVGQPIPTAGRGPESLEALKAEARAQIEALLLELRRS